MAPAVPGSGERADSYHFGIVILPPDAGGSGSPVSCIIQETGLPLL
ncbi:hypothetical protein HMPREF1548_01154 [Clostridium sp. KLE 1755]|nr:hypothetical protein HMPREF1548_01154 [Clostridium sp. KLE 1755]